MSGFGEVPRGSRLRRLQAAFDHRWATDMVTRQAVAREHREAAAALIRAAEAYEGGTLRDVGAAIEPVADTLRHIVTYFDLGRHLRRQLDAADRGDN